VSTDLHHYRLLKLIEANPGINQREMAEAMGVSLGKVNYCVKALVQKGIIKIHGFRHHGNKRAYAYLLTPGGIEAKARLGVTYLKDKMAEYEAIRGEIEELRRETEKDASA
jgi:EPS-associated MarR family transcriptional regulator